MVEPTNKMALGLSVESIAEQAARREGAPSGTTFAVGREVAGRTRGGEAWMAEDSVAVAVVIRPAWQPENCDLSWVLAAVAGTRAIQSFDPRPCVCHWPDSLSVGDRVVGRSYAKAFLGPGIVEFAVLSVRIDLASLSECFAVSTSDLEHALTAQLERAAALAMDEDPSEIRRDFLDVCATFGRTLEIDIRPKGFARGVAVDIAENGGIVVESTTGMREVVTVDALRQLRLLPS